MVDEATRWLKIVPITTKESKEIALITAAEWFCKYPCPKYCIHDNRGKFVGQEISEMMVNYGVKTKPTTVNNPQDNAQHSCMYLLVTELLHT